MFQSPNLSLSDILGKDYTTAVARANEALGVMSYDDTMAIADEKNRLLSKGKADSQ